ncbi:MULTISPECIES: primosomal protein DnaI [unclassified Paenibacillus]|uniref:primosomal protein DnaI n=1 Tax=unclassified Paenibacillus TaxID=185978 RepID=UPI000953E955|nr:MULTISPECIES: primosomal protein DnaI [unclassified Paenibacillus]ASS66664.1 primosomal protein DnaI [Paenibacillus sp. RUD330]SIP99353.1 primosomal protein DnaI [Paenibacillus sp. RU4X]SIQ18383.1 primosomal protein DnaI [Paenibacillus sp. RU4T]
MESLKDLLKTMPGGAQIRARAQKQLQELLDDPGVRKLREQHPDIDEGVVRRNSNLVYQYVKEHRNCSACPGLDECPNDFQGHYTLLSADGSSGETRLIDRKTACRKFIARRNEELIRSRIRSFYVSDKVLAKAYSFEDIARKDSARLPAVKQILQYIDRTKEQGLQTDGLYLTGQFGTGKTFLMGYMMGELAKLGYSGVIVYMPDFVEDLKAMFGEPGRLKETIDLMKEADILIFDDIGAENLSPWVRDHVMGSILNYRMERKPTFYTSNHALDDLEQHFSFTSKDGEEYHKGRRIMDRIRPFVEVIMVKGTNKRGSRGAAPGAEA